MALVAVRVAGEETAMAGLTVTVRWAEARVRRARVRVRMRE